MSKFKLCITGDLGFETWADIPGYEGLYQASTYGRIKSAYYNGKMLNKIVNNKSGYEQVTLCKNKKHKNWFVHILVANTFLPNPLKNQTHINHKSEVKTENQVWNLERCTPKYNINYGTGIQRSAAQKYKPVLQFDMNGLLLNTYVSAKEASIYLTIHKSAICMCCKGKRKSAGGFLWRYV